MAPQRVRGKARGDGHRRENKNRTDQQYAEVVAEALADTARLRDVPDVVERAFDLLNERDDGIEQQYESHRSEHTDIEIGDEADDAMSDLVAFVAERCEKAVEDRLDLIVHTERFEHREGK